MHPAYSVIAFTTASGAGYGLLIALAVAAGFNLVPRTPTFGLVGMGLALAHKVITTHGGRIEVESREGKGTAFTVTLPLR